MTAPACSPATAPLSTLRSTLSGRARGEALLLEHLTLIEKLVAVSCRRRGLGGEEIDELRSVVFEHLIEDDYRVLRGFEGRSRPATFFAVIIQRLLVDTHYRRHGRWRPSAAARRLGEAAVRLETLIDRDGFSPREAIRRLAGELPGRSSERELVELHLRLPPRLPARSFTACDPERLRASSRADERIETGERANARARLDRELERALAELEPETRLVLTLRFRDGRSVRDIARALGRDDRELYRLCARWLRLLRRRLERRGIDRELVHAVIGLD